MINENKKLTINIGSDNLDKLNSSGFRDISAENSEAFGRKSQALINAVNEIKVLASKNYNPRQLVYSTDLDVPESGTL